jgi:PleD family two-component response regulator
MKTDRQRVLVIDDDEVARELLGSELEKAGYEIFSLPSPFGASRLIQVNDVDAVVLDVMMPAMSGDRLATLLRQNKRFSKVAVVLVSGKGAAELSRLAAAVGADAVVSKGDIRQTLAQSVTKAIRGRSQRSDTTRQSDEALAVNGKRR